MQGKVVKKKIDKQETCQKDNLLKGKVHSMRWTRKSLVLQPYRHVNLIWVCAMGQQQRQNLQLRTLIFHGVI